MSDNPEKVKIKMTPIQQITKNFIEKFTNEVSKDENQDKIKKNIIEPLLRNISKYISQQFYPFILSGLIIFILTFLFALIIMVILLKKF